ncbi:mitofilin family membrane protein [Azospirillum sp. HJ39]|uniref:COG4223 family protein n=1 Tax=Azospirillum sp. HJ39 TaxID=3159496 RepID=UPI003557FC14
MTSRPGSERPGTDRDGDGASTGNAAVDRIVERFGGIRPMAHKLDTPVTTVQGWKKRGAIPLARHADLRTAAAKHRIKLDDADLDAATPSEDRQTDAAPAVIVTPAPATPIDVTPADITPADTVPAVEPVPAAAPADSIPGADVPAGPQASDALIPPAAPLGTTEPGKEEVKAEEAKAEDAKPSDSATPWSSTGSTGYGSTADAEPVRPTIAPTPSYLDEPRSGSGFATALSIVALLVGAAALSAPWWGPALPGWPSPAAPAATSGAAAPADPALRAQIQQLVDRVAKLEQRPAAAPAGNGGNAADLTALTGRIDALEKRPAADPAAGAAADDARKALADRLAALEQKLTAVSGNSQAAQELRSEVDSLKQQVSTVSQGLEKRQDAATAAQALVLAAGQLRASLSGGQPFQQDLQAVRALNIADAGVSQPLDAVAPYAAKGIQTRAQLTDRFQPLAGEIVRAGIRGEGNGWIDSAVGKLSTLVTVRREGGGVVGTTDDAIVARAEAALSSGNLGKAVEELSALQGPAAQAAAAWLADAKARLAADQAVRQLNDRAIALMTTAAGGKGAAQ